MKAVTLLGIAVLVAGCGTNAHAPRGQHPATAARGKGTVLQEQPLSRDVTLELPKGWKRTSSAILTNDALEARVEIMIGKSTKPVELELKQFCRMLTVDGWHCQNGGMSDDGSEGSFPYDTPRRRGWIAVRHYEDGTAIILKGEWSPQNDRKARRDFAAIFLSIDPK